MSGVLVCHEGPLQDINTLTPHRTSHLTLLVLIKYGVPEQKHSAEVVTASSSAHSCVCTSEHGSLCLLCTQSPSSHQSPSAGFSSPSEPIFTLADLHCAG